MSTPCLLHILTSPCGNAFCMPNMKLAPKRRGELPAPHVQVEQTTGSSHRNPSSPLRVRLVIRLKIPLYADRSFAQKSVQSLAGPVSYPFESPIDADKSLTQATVQSRKIDPSPDQGSHQPQIAVLSLVSNTLLTPSPLEVPSRQVPLRGPVLTGLFPSHL